MRYFAFIGMVALLSACGTNQLQLAKISEIEMVYNQGQSLNYGDSVMVKFYAVKLGGERVDITNSNFLRVRGNGIDYNTERGVVYIDRRPLQPNQDIIDFKVVLYEKQDSLVKDKTIKLNFNGPLYINMTGSPGDLGRGRISRIGTGVLTDGANGRDGKDGEPGKDARPLTARVWKDGEFYFIRVNAVQAGTSFIYQTRTLEGLVIDVSGGEGGHGGNGGNGARGKNGDLAKDRRPGDGGNGGNGGKGANGGNGAALEVMFHTNTQETLHLVKLVNEGGKGGRGGVGGDGGRAGKPDKGQDPAKDGVRGLDGNSGNPGVRGPDVKVTIEEFDF
jgi:hypothetical protein